MILSSWLTTVSNRIRNANARRRFSRKYRGNRFTRPASMVGTSTSYARPAGDIRESLWHTFDVAPRFHRDSRRFQRQVWNTSDVATMTERLEDRTLLSVNQLGTASSSIGDDFQTISNFSVDAGTNRVLLVFVGEGVDNQGGGGNIGFDSVTFGGNALSGVALESDGTNAIGLWRGVFGDSVSPTVGDIVVTNSTGGGSPSGAFISAIAFSGVNQTSPLDFFVSSPGQNGDTATHTINGSPIDGKVLNFLYVNDGDPTLGAGQTQISKESSPNAGGTDYFSTSMKDGAASVTMSSTFATSPYSHFSFSVQPAPVPSVNLSVNSNAGTEAGTTAITVTATADSAVSGNQTVDLAVTGTGITAGDFTLTDDVPGGNVQIQIDDGQTTGSVTFTVQDENLVEALTETARLTISNPSAGVTLGTTTTQDITITDNDQAVISISDEAEDEGAALSFTVSISNPVDVGVAALVNTANGTATLGDNDYTRISNGSIAFAAFSTADDAVSVTTTSDNKVEPDETLSVILSALSTSGRNVIFNGGGATLTGSGTIINDDADTEVTLVGGVLTITDNNGATNDALTISHSGTDYTITDTSGKILTTAIANASGNLTNSLTIPDAGVTGINFDVNDGDDSVTVNSVQATLSGGFTINDGVGTDSAVFNAALNTGAGNIAVTAETININASQTATGNQTYNGSVTLGASTVLTGAQISLDAVNLGANTLTVANSGNSEITGVAGGTGGLTKNGAGTLTLSGTNTYSGVTTINSGFIDITNGSALGSAAGNTVVNSDGGNNDGLRISGAITSPEPIVIGATAGAGSITSIGGGGGTLSGAITLNDAGADFRGGGNRLTFSGGINSAGNQSLSLNLAATIITNPIDLNNGTFTVTSSGNNKANATQINVGGNDWGLARINFGGYALLGLNDALPTDAGVEFGWDLIGQSDATLDLNGFNQTVASIAQSFNSVDEGGNINITNTGGSASTLTLDVASGTSTYQGRLTGSGANALNVVKSGAGTQVIENLTTSGGNLVNHNHASTTVNGGTLKFLADATLNTFDTSGAIEGIPNNITINGGTLAFEDTAADNRMVHQDDTITFGAAGGGTLDYVAGNFLFQGTAINPTPPEDTFVTTGGAKNLITSSGGTARINPQGGNTVRFDVADGTDAVDLELAVNFENGTLRKLGDGVLTLTNSVNAVNPNTGPGIIIDAGTLDVAESGRLNSGSYARDITINNDGVFRYSSDQNQTLSGTISGSGSLEGGSNSTLTLAGSNITLAGGSVDISNPVIISNDLTIDTTNGGAVAAGADVTFGGTINSNGGNNNLTIDAGNLGEVELSGAIGTTDELDNLSITADSITISGGTVTTIADQTYDGDVTLRADTTLNGVNVSFQGTLDAEAGSTPIEIDYGNLGTFTTASLAEAGVTVTGSADVNVLNFNGLGIVGGDSDNSVDGAELIDFDLGVSRSSVSYTVNSTGNLNGNGLLGERTLEAFGSDGNSLGTVDQDGTGSFDVSGAFGGQDISRFTLQANADNHIVATVTVSPLPPSLTVNASGTTEFNAEVGGTGAFTSLTTDAAGLTELGADINANGSTVTFNDDVLLTGDVVITEAGTGDVTFNGNVDSTNGDNYSLTVDTAGGKTIFNGRVNGDAQGAASDDAGLARTISVDNLQFNASGAAAEITFDINGTTAGTNHDEVVVVGSVDLGTTNNATLNLSVSGFTPAAADEYILISNDDTDSVTGKFQVNFATDGTALGTPRVLNEGDIVLDDFGGSGLAAIISYQGGPGSNDVTLTVAGDIEVTGGTDGNDATEEGLAIRIVNGNVEWVQGGMVMNGMLVGGTVIESRPVASVNSITLTGTADESDAFVIDATNADVIPAGGITVDGLGGTGTDSLTILDPNNRFGTDHTYTYTNVTDGTIDLDGNMITFLGLEPILVNGGDGTNLVFNLPNTADATITLSDAGGGDFTLDGASFETTTVPYPTAGGSLTINMGAAAQTITVGDLSLLANTDLTIAGDANDTVSFEPTAPVTITDALSVTAGTIGQTAEIIVAGVTTLNSLTGDTTLTDADNDFQGVVNAAGVNVDLTDVGSIQLGTVATTTLDVIAGGAGTITQDATQVAVTGAASFTATGNDITLTDTGNNFGGAVSADGANVAFVDANSISIASINATGTVNVTALAGSISDSTDDATTDITAGGLITLTASANIDGAGADGRLDINAGETVNVSSTTAGNILLRGNGALVLTDVDTNNGFIDVTAAGQVTATDVVAGGTGTQGVLDAGDVIIVTTTGDVLVNDVQAVSDDLTINSAGAINETAADGGVDLDAQNLNLTAVTGIGGAGTIEIDAFGGATDGLTASVTGTGVINVSDRTSTFRVLNATTNNGSITIDAAAGNMTVESATAGGANNLTLTTTGGTRNITIQDLDATGDSVIITATGAIIDGGAGQEITATNAELSATTGIGSGNALETTVSNLAFSNTTSGNVQVTNTGGLTIANIGAIATSSNVGTGTTTLTASSPVTFAVNTSSGGNLTVNATESAAATDDITVNAGVTVQSTAGDVTFNAGDDIILTDNTSIVSATGANGDVTMNSGVADTDNVGIQTLNGQINANTTNGVVTLNLNADGSATQNANGRVTGTNLRLLSTGANGSFALATTANNDVDVIAASTTGAINFRDDDGVTVGTVTTVGITTTDDAVTIDSSQGAGGTVTVDQAITTAGTGTTGTVELSGDVDINASLTAAGGSITLRGVAGANSDIDVGAAVTSAASINWAANRDIIISATVQTTQATTDITLTADSDADGSGGVRIATAGQVNAVDELTITGSDLFASGGGAAPIDSVDIQQDGANAQVTAGGNIGIASGAAAAGNADIRVAGIVQSTGAGNVTINANNDLVITVDGDVTSAGGNLNLDGGQDVLIDSGVQVTTTGAGTIDIDAVRSISIAGAATLIQTVNGNLTMDANTAVGAGDFIGIVVDGSTVSTTSGALSLTGTGGADAGSGSHVGVQINNGATISSTGSGAAIGTITIDGTGGGGTLNNDGVRIADAATTVSTVDGNIMITGMGGAGTADRNVGINLDNIGSIVSTGTGANAGTITLNGTGGAGTSSNYGVVMVGTTTDITSTDGAISVTGVGADGTMSSNIGILISDIETISSLGTGANAAAITIDGTGGDGTNGNTGVRLVGGTTDISSVDGNILIQGVGDGSTSVSRGVVLFEIDAVRSTGTGAGAATISINGTGANGTTNNDGILLSGATTSIETADGDVALTGIATSGGDGVELETGITLAVQATGTANIGITGTGGTGDVAVQIDSPISSGTGTITITALDGASATDDITFGAAGDITSTSGLISIDGDTATSNTADVTMADGAVINAGTGTVEIIADVNFTVGEVITSGLVNAAALAGSIIDADAGAGNDITAGSLAISGETGVGSDADAIETTVSTLAGRANSGDFNISNTGNLDLGAVALAPLALGLFAPDTQVIGVTIEDSADDNSTNDNLTVVTSGSLTVSLGPDADGDNGGVDNNDGGNVTLTANGATADLTISAPVNVSDGDGVQDGIGNIDVDAGRDVIINNDALVATDASGQIFVDAVRRIDVSSNAATTMIQSIDGAITMNANAAMTSTGEFFGIVIDDANITTSTGAITVTGVGGNSGNSNHGVRIQNGALVESTGNAAGTISIDGTGRAGVFSEGIRVADAATLIQSVDANIALTGVTASDNGVEVNEATVRTTGTGTIVIDGTSTGTVSSGTANNGSDGVLLAGSSALITTTGPGAATISISGQSAGDEGIELNSASVSTVGSLATISLSGSTTATGGSDSDGIHILGADARISSASGEISITGETNGGGTAGDGVEIAAGVTLAIDANGTAGITISGTGDGAESGVQINSPVESEMGAITIRSEDGGSTTDDITFGAGGDITSTSGLITIDADTATSNTADVFMANGAVINAGSGQIDIDADVNVTLGSIQTTSTADPAIEIDALAGAVIDGGDADIDIVTGAGGSVVIRSVTGIGSGDALETDLNASILAAINTTSGTIEIDDTGANTSLLTIGTVDGLAGITNQTPDGGNPSTTGFISVSNASPIDVVDNITANGDITLTTGDTDAINVDNLFIDDVDTLGNDLLIESTGGSITLNVGDDAVIEGDLTAASIITINIDQPGAAGADAVVLTGGGTLDIRLDEAAGTAADAVLTTTGGTFINGGDEDDTFIFQAQSTTNFVVNGNPPAFGDAGVPPGDTLRLDFTNVVNPPILATGIPGAGVFSFQALPAPGDDELSVSYSNIETVDKVNGTVNYHLVIDPTLPGSYGNQTADPDDTRDDLTVRLNPDETGSGGPVAGTDLIIERTAAPGGDSGDFVGEIFRGTLADILSLTIQGTDDDETLTIDESNGLPSFNNAGGFAAVAPSTRGIDNSLREIWFNGSFSNSDLDLDNVDLNNLVINDSDLLSRDRGTTTLLEGPLSYTGATANTRSGGLTGTTTHAGAWVGAVTIGPAGGFADPLEEGVVTFGTESNDGSQFWVDLDQDGIFSRTGADGDELIVDNSAGATDVGGAPVSAVGTVDFSAGGLGAGVYSVAITYYTRTAGTEGIEARFAQGNVAYGAATVIDPSAAGQQGLWRSERLDNVHLTNADDGNDRAEFVFIGRGGTNAVVYNLGSANTVSQTYAIGDGLGGGDNAASGHSEGAILTRDDTNNESQLFYFTGLEPITVSGTAGGRLTILADNEDNLINIEDDATTAGNTLITASTPATGSGVGTYESYSFAANTFANIDVFGMLGADSIDLIALDANQNSSMIELNGDDTLDGDTSDDTIRVRSYPAGNMSSLFGGAGDDTFNIFDAANTVDGILGRMMIDGEGGTDTVIVDDSGSNPAGDDGETVTVNIPPGAPNLPGIDGIFGEGAGVNVMGTDIILANVTATAPGSVEVLTISTSADNDDINVDMNGVTATDLTTITINGSDGSDLFNIQSDTPSDATTNLNGNAGADQFFFEAGTFVVTGAIDGGADNDALDYSAYGSGRTIQLTAVGSTDGFQGNDATAGGTSIAPVAAASFDNIDILIGSSMDDTLIGADLRNHWDIGGDIDGFDDAHFNPTGGARTDGGLQLVNSLADAGVLIADESDLSLTGNATTVGRPTGANPIVPNAAGEQDLAFTDFQFFVGALTADDHFDLRDGASVTGTIDGRGGSDSIDYRDFTTAVLVDLNTGEATNVNVSGGGAGAGQAGGLEASGSSPDDNSIENAFGGDADDMIFGDDDNNILGDGFGNDLLIGDRAREGADPTGITSGDDTFRLEPRAGDNDIVFDLAGSDTVDFRFATQGIVYDADIVGSTATPFLQDVFNGAGATVDLRRNEDDGAGGIPQPATGNTPFENVVGTQFNDIIHIDPLSISGNFPTEIPVNRFVDGNDPFVGGPDDGIPPDPGDPIPPGDILRFDGKGAVVQDTGLSLTAQGVGTVAYRSIETITSFDDAPRIIDNGDDAVTTFPNTTRPGQNSATWNVISNVGFQDDYLFSVGAGVQGTDNPNIVTWTANGVADGLYRISLTWPDLGVQNGASSTVPVQIFDGDTLLATLSVNQRLAPSDLLDEGVFWDDLGIFNFQTHTARIVLSNDTEGTVLADAVRLEQISPNPELQVELQDTGEYIADGVDIVDVTTVIEQPQTRTFTVSNDGTADLMITDIELEQNGGNNWQLTTPLGTSFTLPPGQSTFVAVTLLATTANGQADYPAELRIFSNDVDENVLQLPGQGVNPDPDGDPLNDVNPFTIPLNGVVSTVDIIDDTDVRFDTVGVWDESGGLQSVPNSFGTGIKTAPNDGDGERALWTFSDLPDGRYRVSVTWPNEERLNLTTVEYRVRNSSATLSTTQVDQSVAPAGLNANGTTFQDLGGPFDITDGTIIVELRDTKIGTRDTLVAADAVRIERLFDTVADATLFDGGVGGTEVADDTGVVSFGTVLPGTQVQKTFTVRNDGMQDLTVREPVSLPAGYTLISFNGAAPTNATEVTLMPGQTVDFVVQLNASTAGVVSGEMSFATGELAGGANADPDENPINVTLTATVQSTIIVDNHDAGFSTTGNAFQLFLGGPQGYNSEGNKTIHIADANGTGDTAVWTIPVEPGGRYRIGATYTLAAGNGPTNAPYTVAGVVGGTTVPINQRVLPDDRFANGSAFEDLGVFVADGTGTITVTLADTGNGAAVADAIRVEALFGPEIEVLDNTSGTNLQDGASTVDFGDTTQGSGALSRTFTITNDGERELALGTISLPNNFQLAGTFPTSIAANGGTGTFTLQLTTADAGTFGGVVSFTNDDADESPFNFDVTGTVIGAAPVIIDNGDAGFSSVGLFNSQSNGGRNGTYFQALNGDGSSVATWQFTGLAAGVYNVAATWGGYFIRATNAPYTITDSTGSTTVEVNQRLDPDDFTENFMGITASWENLGQSFVVDGTGTLTVTLSNLADNYVYADAIRVERTGDLPEIVVTDLGPDQVAGGGNDVNLPDGGTFDFGSVTPGVPVTRTFQITNAGTAALTTGTLTLPSGFSTTYMPQTLAASGTATFDVTYDALADATGTFSFPTNDDDESPFNFTLTGSVAATVTVIDDGDGGFMTPTGGFSTVTTQNNEGFQGDIRTATGDASGNTATWTFSGLTVGGTYRVSSTWFPFFNRATDAPFTISGIDGGPLTVDVNQRLIPGSFTESGEDWLDLELVRVAAGGQITVTLSDDADGLVVADAIRVEQVVGNDPEIVVHNGGLVIADGSTFDFGTVGQNGTLSQTFTVVNSGQTDLTVQTPILPPGFTTPFTTTTIAAGDTADIVVSVSTSEQANLSGAMSISSNDGNESPFNLNLQATVEGPTPTIIDNGDVGFAAAGGFSAFNGQGFRGDVHFVNGGTPGATATYSFTGLADGQYLVSTTWTPLSDRASDAPYTVTDSVNGGVTIDISQRNAPDDFNADGVSWEELGIFTVSGGAGTITVGLTGDADNIVIADAVRLDPVVGAEITVLEGSTVISLGGTLDFGDVVQGTANVTRTITVRNDGPEDLILQPIPALTGFTISNSNFTAGQMLATGATASFDITIDTASLGTLTDELEFSNNDADEGPFRFTVTGNIVADVIVPLVIDNGDATGYTQVGDFTLLNGPGFLNDMVQDTTPNAGGGMATWTFTDLDAGTYRVSATWDAFYAYPQASNAPFTISGIDGGPVTVNIDQRVNPDDFTFQGEAFEDLGVFTLSGSTITVSLSDMADGSVLADAIRIEQITGSDITVAQGGTDLLSGSSTVAFDSQVEGGTGESITFTVSNVGPANLVLQPVVVGAGFVVTDNFTAGDMVATSATDTFTIQLDTSTPGDFSATVSLPSNDPDENPFVFTVTGTVTMNTQPLIIDNNDAGFSSTPNFVTMGGQGYNATVLQSDNSDAGVATWTFTGLPAGTYRVGATWTTAFDLRATDAMYSIDGGAAIVVNQRQHPVQSGRPFVLDGGSIFADLDSGYAHAGGDLTITLSDTPTGVVIADAIRLERLAPLQVRGGQVTPAAEVEEIDQQDAGVEEIFQTAVDIWASTQLTEEQSGLLSTVTFHVRDLTDGHLGAASNHAVFLDINGAGYGWFVDSTPLMSEEFELVGGELVAVPGGPADGQIDLLTVVLHELGHVIGLEDLSAVQDENDLMFRDIAAGLRRLPGDHGSSSTSTLPVPGPSVDLTSGGEASDGLNGLLQTPLIGSQTPAELYADRKDDEADEQTTPGDFSRVEHDDTNGIDNIFTLLTEEDALSSQNPFDEI